MFITTEVDFGSPLDQAVTCLNGMSEPDSAAHIARLIPGNTLAGTERHKEDQQQ